MKTEVVITMTITELGDLRHSTDLAMEALKDKVGRLDIGDEKNMIIQSYKELEKFRNNIDY